MNKLTTIKHDIKRHKDKRIDFIPIKNLTITNKILLKKPEWIKIKIPVNFSQNYKIKKIIRKNNIHTVCEEASCPNIYKCFNRGKAAFMILGTVCTRRCPFCDVSHGRPIPPDINEPYKLAQTISSMSLRYVVITSVNRDDLRDGGAQHFADCILAIRNIIPNIKVEILVPDFRGKIDCAIEVFSTTPPDVFNHNLETVLRLYRMVRPGANYKWSLKLLERFKQIHPDIPTKSGIMVGLGETDTEIIDAMNHLRNHGVTMLTLGQYLQPSRYHIPVQRYVTLNEFEEMKSKALDMGFINVACGPFIRSSYDAEFQAEGKEVI